MSAHPRAMRRDPQLPAQLREHLVGFPAVAVQASSHQVLPRVLPSPASRNDVVDRIRRFPAVRAGIRVSTQNAPTRDMKHVAVGASYIAF